MIAKAIKPFKDKVEGVIRKKGDTFTVSEERLKEINSTKFGVLAEAVAEETAKPKKPKKG
jgi:hypothetical protein